MSVAQGPYPGNKLENYEEILAGAHRNPAPRIGAPALVCHVAFWNPLRPDPSTPTDQARYNRNLAADKYLSSIWKTVHSLNRSPSPSNQPITENRVNGNIFLLSNFIDAAGNLRPYDELKKDITSLKRQTVTFRFAWFGLRATVRLEQYSEYIAVTFVIDLATEPVTEFDSAESSTPNPLPDLLERFSELNRMVASEEYFSVDNYKTCHDAFYRDIWNVFHDTVLAPSASLEAGLGKIFADFRGLILCAPAKSDESNSAFRAPFWRHLKTNGLDSPEEAASRRGFGEDIPEISDDGAMYTLDKFWNFITSQFIGIEHEEFQITASRLIDNRAIYASALGAQPSELQRESRTPIYYFLYVNTLNHWQIGRLIDRLHEMERVRLAALVEFEQLRTADYKLQEIDADITNSFLRFQKEQEQIASLSDNNEKESHLKQTKDWLDSYINQIEHRSVQISEPFDGDIEHRIERSRYYISQFRSNLPQLRVARIEGFQPYDDFVEQRLGSSFNAIEYFYKEYNRISEAKENLHRYFRIIDRQFTEIEARNRSEDIERIQDIGDLALWVVLVPYYFGSVFIEHIFHFKSASATLIWLGFWNTFTIGWSIAKLVRTKNSIKRTLSSLLIPLALLLAVDLYFYIAEADPGAWRRLFAAVSNLSPHR